MIHTTDFPKEGNKIVLQFVTGYTCDNCSGTNCTDTHQRTDKQGKHQCYQCKDCGHKMSYPDN